MNVDLAERERRGESTYKNSNTPWTTLLQDVQTPVITLVTQPNPSEPTDEGRLETEKAGACQTY